MDWDYSIPVLAVTGPTDVYHCQSEEVQVFVYVVSMSLHNSMIIKCPPPILNRIRIDAFTIRFYEVTWTINVVASACGLFGYLF